MMAKTKVDEPMLTMAEARLIAIYRAIKKANLPEIVDTADASVIYEYVDQMVDMDHLEQLASAENLEWYLDGLIMGTALARVLITGVAIDKIPLPDNTPREFQTGIDPENGTVRVNN